MGGYRPQHFMKYHETHFIVAPSRADAKRRAMRDFAPQLDIAHRDNALDVDELLDIASHIPHHHIVLTPTDKTEKIIYSCGFQLLPPKESCL